MVKTTFKKLKKKTVGETLLLGHKFHLAMQNKILRGSVQQGDDDDAKDSTLNCGPLVCALVSTEGTWGRGDASFFFLFKNGIFQEGAMQACVPSVSNQPRNIRLIPQRRDCKANSITRAQSNLVPCFCLNFGFVHPLQQLLAWPFLLPPASPF